MPDHATVVGRQVDSATSKQVGSDSCLVNISASLSAGESLRATVGSNCSVTLTRGRVTSSRLASGKVGNAAPYLAAWRRCTSTNSYDYNIGPTVLTRLYTYIDFDYSGSQVTTLYSISTNTYTSQNSGVYLNGVYVQYRDTFTPDWDVRGQDEAQWYDNGGGWHHSANNNAYGYGDGGCHTWFNHYGLVCGLCSVNFYVDAS